MTMLWGMMCIFIACSPSSSGPQTPNLIVATSPAYAAVSVTGGTGVTTLAEPALGLQAGDEAETAFHVQPGAYYTVTVDADEHSSFTRRIFVRDDRRITVNVGLARKGGKKASGGYTEAFEAESATSGSNLDVGDDDQRASAGAYLTQPASVPNTGVADEDAFVAIDVPANDQYTLWARMYASSDDDDAMYLGFDRQLARSYPDAKGEYTWVLVGKTRLTPGSHRISIGHAEAGARLDLFVVTTEDLSVSDLNAFVTQVAVTETPVSSPAPAPTEPTPTEPAPADPTPLEPSAPQDQRAYALRGNPNFSPSQLSSEARRWYDTLWAVIDNPNQYPNAMSMARTGDVYKYRGDLQDYVLSLMTAFRLTGDLRLLDEVSEIAEAMRSKLADEWKGTRDGTDGTRDGFLNWLDLYDTNSQYAGKDTQMAFDLKANTLAAMIAWALQNNRDLRSPAGYDYGAQADFWKDYLVKHFEAKWRKRNGKPTGFPFAEQVGLHTYHSFMRWHYYMGKLTGNSAYTREATRMADKIWSGDFRETSSKYGPAIVWSRGVMSLTDTSSPWYDEWFMLMPQHYARYIVFESVDLHLEGFNRYASDATLQKMARGVSDFVVGSSFDSFARDIGGGSSRAGLPASPTSWSTMDRYRFSESGWSFLSPWDGDSGNRIRAAADSVFGAVEMPQYGGAPKRIFIPAAMFAYEQLK